MSLERADVPQITPSIPTRPRVWPVYVLFLLALLATTLATVVVIGVSYSFSHPGAAPTRAQLMAHALQPTSFTLTILVSALVLSGASFGAAALSAIPLLDRLSLRVRGLRVLPVLAAMGGLPALSMVLENAALLAGVKISGTLEMIAHSIGSARGLSAVFIVLAISLGPGIGEELLFRGYIQTRLLRRHTPAVAIIVTSLLFGLMHMDALQSSLTVFMGVYLGFLAYRFGSLWPAVGAHALNNGLSALSLTLFPEEPASTEPSLFGMMLGALVCAGCLTYVLRSVPRPFLTAIEANKR